MFLMFYISLSLAAYYYDYNPGITGCICNNVGEKNGQYTCDDGEGGSCGSDEFCSYNEGGSGTSDENICKPGCVAEWEGRNNKDVTKNCYNADFSRICTNNKFKDSNDKTAADGCPQCDECYATCDTFNCGNAGKRENPALCDGPCIFNDCCNYHFDFACNENNSPEGQNPKWFSDGWLRGGEQGLILESNIDNPFDRSIKYVVDFALDDSLASNDLLILEDCESTIMQSWKVFGYTISDGERIEITDRFGYGNPISNNGGIDNQRAVSNDLLLNGGDCENYQFLNLAKLMPSNGAAEMVRTFSEFSRVEVEPTISISADTFRGILKVNLRCIAEESGEARESTVCTSIDDCDAGMDCNIESDAPQGVCEERFENILRCNEGPQNFWTRNSDGTTPICHDFNPHVFTTTKRHISYPCVKIQIPEFSDLIPWEGTVGFPNLLHMGENDEPDWSQFRGWQIHMCGTEAVLPDEVGFGILMRDTRYATENILHVRESDYTTLQETDLASRNGVDAEKCRTLNVNKEDFVHSPGFSWKTFGSRSIQRQQYEIWVYQYPRGNCPTDMESCERYSVIIDENSDLYMTQTIQIEFLCDQPPPQTTTTTIPPPAPQPYLKEADYDLRNAWRDEFDKYIRDQADLGIDVSYQIVNAVRGAFHDMIMGDNEEENGIPMGCLKRIGASDPAVKPFMDLRNELALDMFTLQETNKILSEADYSVILGALCIDWTSREAQNSYDWNENDNLLHKIRVGRSDVESTLCRAKKDELEERLPKQEVQIEDPDTGELRPSSPEEPLFNPNELEDIRAGVQTSKGRMTSAHEEFKRAMLTGALTMRDAVALMGGHGLGFIRMLAEWAPLASEDDSDDSNDDCSLLRGGPWTTRPHVFDNEYFIILRDLLTVAESNMDAWTEMEPARTIWDAQDAINWIFRCGEDIPKIPVDTAKLLTGSTNRWSPIDPTEIGPNDDDPRFNSKLQMLDADLSLVFAEDTRGFVREFANREISFFDAFHTAYIKLSEYTKENLIPYTHPNGEPESLLERNPEPTMQPTATDPSTTPSQLPSSTKPSQSPSSTPSTDEPTNIPTTAIPSKQPNLSPTPAPTPEPTSAPTTADPSLNPSISVPSRTPSKAPSTNTPTSTPSAAIPDYPYPIHSWTRMTRLGDVATCQFTYQPNDYRIGRGSGSSASACQRSCEENAECVSFTLRSGSYGYCELYKYLPSHTYYYAHGGKFSCWMYDGGKGVQPLYHWMGWGSCSTDSGSSMSFFRTITASSLESCMQHCRNENCLSVTWSYSYSHCRLHQHYASGSVYGKERDSIYEQCYNILYNYEL